MNIKERIIRKYLKKNGPIKTIRVSSAQAKGIAKNYPYWGAVRYNIIITKNGNISNVACERATSDRRSINLADDDAVKIAKKENRLFISTIGRLNNKDIDYVLKHIKAADKVLL